MELLIFELSNCIFLRAGHKNTSNSLPLRKTLRVDKALRDRPSVTPYHPSSSSRSCVVCVSLLISYLPHYLANHSFNFLSCVSLSSAATCIHFLLFSHPSDTSSIVTSFPLRLLGAIPFPFSFSNCNQFSTILQPILYNPPTNSLQSSRIS